MRCALDGSDLSSWPGVCATPTASRFLPDGRLLATDQGADDRGSRPVGEAPDLLYEVAARPLVRLAGLRRRRAGDRPPLPARARRPATVPAGQPRRAAAVPNGRCLRFAAHAAATKLASLPADLPVWPGQILVALFGDERPMTAPDGPRVGRALARIDPADWSLHLVAGAPLKRPIDVAVAPDGDVSCWISADFENRGPPATCTRSLAAARCGGSVRLRLECRRRRTAPSAAAAREPSARLAAPTALRSSARSRSGQDQLGSCSASRGAARRNTS